VPEKWGYDWEPRGERALDRGRIARAREGGGARRRLRRELTVPREQGLAFEVRRGESFRLIEVDGPQVCDLNAWRLDDPRERLWTARTKQLEASHLTVGNRLWSVNPWVRPLLTIIDDTVERRVTPRGGQIHDVLGTRCDPFMWAEIGRRPGHRNCHDNLAEAIAPWGLDPFHVHDPMNVFQVTGIGRDDDRYFIEPTWARQGDYIEFLAEHDLLIGVSACPAGSEEEAVGGDTERTTKALGVAIYAIDH
jgi:uncharacterized protein YcgI (DUF1989 family)